VNVLLIQNKVFENKEKTISELYRLLKDIDFEEIDLVVLPEMFLTPYDIDHLNDCKEGDKGTSFKFLEAFSKEKKVYLIGGTIPFQIDDKVYNSSFIFDDKGRCIDRYDKRRLFGITYPDGRRFDEGDVLSKGNRFVTFKMNDQKIGIMICFDIRFPIIAETYRNMDCDMIVVPAAFNSFTGPLHWETLFRCRAIDNQLFMIGCSPSNDSFGEYNTYGHSLVVDPYGTVISKLGGESSCKIVGIDFSLKDSIRNLIPLK
jgi:predicted amidohydrolase